MSTSIRATRLHRELTMLQQDPPPGISCWQEDDSTSSFRLCAKMEGPPDSPYKDGIFTLSIETGERYPMEPPHVYFQTKIYHPNIDHQGRICLDLLKLPPKGAWKPSVNISTLLSSIRLLLGDPNPDDPLDVDIAKEFKCRYDDFLRKAQEYTLEYAK